MAERIPSTTAIRVPLKAYLSSDHVTPATGKTIAVTISKNGASYANPSAGATNAVEIGSGSYYVDLSTTDSGTAGPLFVLGTCSGVDPVEAIYNVVAQTNGGFTALPAAVAGANAGLPVLSVSGTTLGYTLTQLSSTGLDAISISDPGGVSGQTTFPKILVALYRRFLKKSTLTVTQLKLYGDDGSTVNTTQAVSDDGTTQTIGPAT